jgi:glycosyltransferase involved in cell wall biosynthesis
MILKFFLVHIVSLQGKVRVKVCTAVWSDGPRKNWSLLQFLDRELDHTHYELILVGRTPANTTLLHTTVIPPMKQGPLGSLLRKMHIFLAPSYNECFSNAEVQALACGLPVLALHDSSHVEVVQEGGRFFSGEDDVLSELSALTANYAYYAQRVGANDIDDVALRYLCASRLC